MHPPGFLGAQFLLEKTRRTRVNRLGIYDPTRLDYGCEWETYAREFI